VGGNTPVPGSGAVPLPARSGCGAGTSALAEWGLGARTGGGGGSAVGEACGELPE
jgi:hypothetical protein